MFSKGLLRLEQLLHAVSTSLEDKDLDSNRIPSTELVMDITVGLVFHDPLTGMVFPVHKTARDYFSKREPPGYCQRDVQVYLALSCLHHMNLEKCVTLFQNDLPEGPVPIEEAARLAADSYGNPVTMPESPTKRAFLDETDIGPTVWRRP